MSREHTDSTASTEERTRAIVLAFAREPDPRYLAEDATFAFMERNEETGADTGREIRGRAAIAEALDHFYRRAAVARTDAAEVSIIGGRAMVEVAFSGRELGEFFGLATTSEAVVVPCEMVFTMEGDTITTGYLSFDLDALRRQVGAARE